MAHRLWGKARGLGVCAQLLGEHMLCGTLRAGLEGRQYLDHDISIVAKHVRNQTLKRVISIPPLLPIKG